MNSKHFLIIYFIVGLLGILPIQSKAQKKIEFDKLVNDLGTFSEDSEPKVCTFKFTNRLAKAIAIVHVQSTCGCTIPEYTKKIVRPGESGEINITYNPQGHPGIFNRAILVSFSDQADKVRLFVKGTVTPGVPRKDSSYPYVVGNLQLRTTGLKFKPMQITQQRSIMVINSSNIPFQTIFQSNIPSLSAEMVPSTLQPNQKGEIQIIYKGKKNDAQPFCIRLKENARQQKKAGTVFITIDKEICNQ